MDEGVLQLYAEAQTETSNVEAKKVQGWNAHAT